MSAAKGGAGPSTKGKRRPHGHVGQFVCCEEARMSAVQGGDHLEGRCQLCGREVIGQKGSKLPTLSALDVASGHLVAQIR